MGIDIGEVLAYLIAISGLIWGFFEHRSKLKARAAETKASEGDYVADLASAAHDLVKTSQLEVQDLRVRLGRLEEKLEVFGCRIVACPKRRPLINGDKP